MQQNEKPQIKYLRLYYLEELSSFRLKRSGMEKSLNRIIASALNPYPPIGTFPLKGKGLKTNYRTLQYAS
jgi:hypothetical protein